MTNKRTFGFTLIELMIVVVIIGVIAAIAYPAYTNWVVQTRRSDAQIALTTIAANQEKFFTSCNRYSATISGGSIINCNGLGYQPNPTPGLSPDGHYTLVLSRASVSVQASGVTTFDNWQSGYTATATPVATSPQAGNGALRIDSTGRKEWNRLGGGTWIDWKSKK